MCAKQQEHPEQTNKRLAVNKKARFEYSIIEAFEAGIVLTGSEVKSVKEGRINIAEGYVKVVSGELYLTGVNVSVYEAKGYVEHDPLRDKKLLMHKQEIVRLGSKIQEKQLTIIALSVYQKKRKIKIELALVKGKKLHDKRDDLKEKAVRRDLARDFKFR
jgi:SsrA-binding protein